MRPRSGRRGEVMPDEDFGFGEIDSGPKRRESPVGLGFLRRSE